MAGTIQQIAELAEVSRGTVDRALNNRGRVNSEVAKRIEDIARDMGYVPKSRKKAAKASGMGYTDQDGNERIPCIYEDLDWSPSQRCVSAVQNGKSGWITLEGREIVPCVYDFISRIETSGLFIAEKDGKKAVLIKKEGLDSYRMKARKLI